MTNKKVGISAVDYYVPKLTLHISDLAVARNIEPAKLEFGLGLKEMAVPDVDEDTASFAANALLRLISNNQVNPSEIGRVYMGTESAVDAAKPTSMYAIGVVESKLEEKFGPRCFKNCDVVDMTFACIGAIDALQNCLDWVRLVEGRKAIVIASDVAKYKLGSTGEYTQGAGAVAFLVEENPQIISIKDTWGVSSNSVSDFFKPRKTVSVESMLSELLNEDSAKREIEIYSEEPVFDGQYSNECYQSRMAESLAHFGEQKAFNFLNDWQHLIFHLPYAFQGRRMIVDTWLEAIEENNLMAKLQEEIGPKDELDEKTWRKSASKSSMYKSFVNDKIASGEKASSLIGNMYTASIFMSLVSMLITKAKNATEISADQIGFLSYGSGSKSKVFEGTVEPNWKENVQHLELFEELGSRLRIDVATYEDLHNKKVKEPISTGKRIGLSSIKTEINQEGYRIYG